jgi:GT2 family glycosyltransferase
MTVFVLIPVFNRLEYTKSVLRCLRKQALDEPLNITIIDDGSTDGTADFLKSQRDISVLQGDGNLWWGGAIDLGLKEIFPNLLETDWILFCNNDTEFSPDFVQNLLRCAQKNYPAAVGSIVRDIEFPHEIISIGPVLDSSRLVVSDRIIDSEMWSMQDSVEVDALSGRGALYSAFALKCAVSKKSKLLPHYLADYELSLRVKACGWHLLASLNGAVYSKREFGSAYQAKNIREKFFSLRSPTYLPSQVSFWWQASGLLGRITLPVRLMYHFIKRQCWGRR